MRNLLALALALLSSSTAWAVEIERPPISYSQSKPANLVSQLQQQIDRDALKLAYDQRHGYLPALLKALDVPVSSQTLVFSKTSLQRQRIAPRTPRAIYFNDDVYVGYCQDGEVMEVSIADAKLGTVFYTLAQEESAKPQFLRQTDNCLLCHGSSQNEGLPGHLMRSVFADRAGLPVLSRGSYHIDQTSAWEKRWGGWYVTGTHGDQPHLGNLVLQGTALRDNSVDNADGLNVTDLADRFDTSAYLSPHSDVVALMVLAHQATMHNLITRASFLTRAALYEEAAINRELGEPTGGRRESSERRIRDAAEPLVNYILFAEEAPLISPVAGTSAFAQEFAARGPRDKQGRSLREFDLKRRLFKYPCSYLIYSPSFDALPAEVLAEIYRRLWEVLSGKDSKTFAHLSTDDRRALLEIIRDTKSNLPDSWQQ
jgi:hypothetical protein